MSRMKPEAKRRKHQAKLKRPVSQRIVVLAAPLLLLSILQTDGCARSVPPPPPGGTYLSTSAGASFSQSVQIAGRTGEYIAGFPLKAAHRPAHNPNTIYIAAANRGIIVSVDGGETWNIIGTPLSSILDVVALGSGVLVASGVDASGQGYIIRSLDQGKSWQIVLTVPIPQEDSEFRIIGGKQTVASVVSTLELDPFNTDRVYAASNLGTIFVGEQSAKVWRSVYTLGLNSRRPAHNQAVNINKLVPSPHRFEELLVITEDGSFTRVRDGTEEIIEIPKRITDQPPRGIGGGEKKVLDAAYVADFPDALFIGVEDGAVITRDGGQTWIQLKVPVDISQTFNTVTVAVSPTNSSRLFVAINSVIYRSEDGGQTWNTVSLGISNHLIIDVLIDPVNAARVLVVTTPQDA